MTTRPKRPPGSVYEGMQVAHRDVGVERMRQLIDEGFSPRADDEYTAGELARAAGCYVLGHGPCHDTAEPPHPWPWGPEAWKPTTRRRDLVKAAALILAEIERLDRAVPPKPGRYRDTDGAIGTLSEFDAFANRYTFTPDGHRPPAVLPDPQPAHLRDRHLGPDDVRRLVPFELGSVTDAADHIEWKATHDEVPGA